MTELFYDLRSYHIQHVACGKDHTVCLCEDGHLFTFGAGTYGKLADHKELTLVKVGTIPNSVVTQVSCGKNT